MAVKTIVLKGNHLAIRKEAFAQAAITPGDLIELVGDDNVQKHSVAAGNAQKAFAVENEVVGKGIDTDYAINDTVLYGVFARGTEVYARVAAGAPAIVRGAILESAGDGTLRAQVVAAATSQAQRESAVAVALQTVDNSGGGAAVRIKAELL